MLATCLHLQQVGREIRTQLDQLRQSPYRFTQEGQSAIKQLQESLQEAKAPEKAPDQTSGAPATSSKFKVVEIK